MIRLRRRNTAWLAALGILIAFALLAGPVAVPVQALLLTIFALAMVASTVEFGKDRETLIDAIRRAPIRQRVSPHAKEALERARDHGGYITNTLILMDVGLIASQSSYEGLAMRRTRSVSKDDDGVRPFITLFVDPEEADRNTVIRYEIFDQYGDRRYVHELRTYLRSGEMNIMADHHLPLAGNEEIDGSGDWDLRVYLDGNLVGIHNFMLTPSINERTRRLQQQRRATAGVDEDDTVFEIVDEVEQPPRSLQDLLSEEQAKESSSRRRTTSSTTRRRR